MHADGVGVCDKLALFDRRKGWRGERSYVVGDHLLSISRETVGKINTYRT